MFNGIFDDLPVGQMLLQYKIYVPLFQHQIKKIKLKFKSNILVDSSIHESLADLEAYLYNQELIEYKSEYVLNMKGTNFDTSDEEEQYKYDVKSFLAITNNLYILGIKHKVNSLIQSKDADGKIINSGPIIKYNI